MNRVPRRSLALLSLATTVLVLAVTWPHRHGEASSAHQAHACRVCQVQTASSPQTGAAGTSPRLPLVFLALRLRPSSRPVTPHTVRLPDGRAPPRLS